MGRPWTAREDLTLRIEWGDVGADTIAAKLPGRTWTAILCRAERLGLGSPSQGWVSLREAARRCGYHIDTLRAILRTEGVTLRSHPGGRLARRHRRALPRYLVDLDEASAAVERHLARQREAVAGTESITEACERTGLSLREMELRLDRAGLLPVVGRGHVRRLCPADVDRALAQWQRVPAGPAWARLRRERAEERAA